jgi:hypothetical protein
MLLVSCSVDQNHTRRTLACIRRSGNLSSYLKSAKILLQDKVLHIYQWIDCNTIDMEPHSETDLVSFAFSGPTTFDPSKPIYIDARNPSRAFNAIQFRQLVRSLIAGLRARGVERGDCVLVQLENSVITPELL